MSEYQGKKSKRNFRKTKISLCEKVATLVEFEEMYKKHVIPLAIVLTSEELNKAKAIVFNLELDGDSAFNYLLTNYYKSSLSDNNSSNIYIYLDSYKLKEDFYQNKIYIDKLIDKEGISRRVDSMFYNEEKIMPLGINVINKNKIKNINSCIIFPHSMAKQLITNHINNQSKISVLTQEQIDEIHAQGFLTIDELINEWVSWGLCVPDSKERCKKFINCHDCLLDYACHNLGYKSNSGYLKTNGTYEDYETLQLIKK